MKYVRNSGKKKTKKPVKEKDLVPKKGQKGSGMTEKMKTQVIDHLIDDAKWVSNLDDTEQFSKDWVQKVLLEILMQCMGKKDILTTNMFGQQIVARMFKEKGAIQVASILAKMNGHLFDVVKGSLKTESTIEHKHEVKLLPEPDRTGSVLDILESCGAFNPATKRLTKDDVEIISA